MTTVSSPGKLTSHPISDPPVAARLLTRTNWNFGRDVVKSRARRVEREGREGRFREQLVVDGEFKVELNESALRDGFLPSGTVQI